MVRVSIFARLSFKDLDQLLIGIALLLGAMDAAKVYTPKDFELNRIMFDIVGLVDDAPIAAE